MKHKYFPLLLILALPCITFLLAVLLLNMAQQTLEGPFPMTRPFTYPFIPPKPTPKSAHPHKSTDIQSGQAPLLLSQAGSMFGTLTREDGDTQSYGYDLRNIHTTPAFQTKGEQF